MATATRRKISRYRQKKYSFKQLKERLDPELWQAIMLRDHKEQQKPGTWFKTEDNEIWLDVLVKLGDRRKKPGVLVSGLTIENPDPKSWEAIVTGAVRQADIETLRQDDNVISLKLSRKVIAAQEMAPAPGPAAPHGEIPGQLPGDLDGSGVLVGVVDFGCDFAHPNFRDEQGGSRLLYLWDQRGQQPTPPGEQFLYGQELTKQDLDRALQPPAQDPYGSVGYRLSADAHGTPVLDIAAGNGRGTDLPGAAPKAHLVFVDLGEPSGEEDPLNDRRLLDAVGYIFEKADELGLPAVVNLSLGLFAGSHDGRSLLEQGLDWLLSKPKRAIVVAAGNAGNLPIHATGSVPAQGSIEIEWKVLPNGHRDDECEIWYPGSQELQVTLLPPKGVTAQTKPVALRQAFELLAAGKLIGNIIHEKADPNNGDHQIKLRVPPIEQPDKVWKIRLDNPGREDVPFHAWIERDDQGQSCFLPPHADPSCTLGSLACGLRTLVVGGHGMHGQLGAAFSGAGPTRDGRRKPEVCAPAVDVLAAKARSNATRTTLRGTSAAAPHATGLIARLYQAGGSLAVAQARQLVTGRGRSIQPGGTNWNPRTGFGPINAAALSSLRSAPANLPAQPLQPEARLEGNGSRPAEDGKESSWQAQLMQQLLVAAASGKIRISFEIDPRDGR